MNGTPSADVDTSIELRLLLPEQPSLALPVSLLYESVDPYAVTVRFQGPEEQVEWVFARELLAAGLEGVDGLGDVQVRAVPADPGGQHAHVIISLASPDGRAELEADPDDLRDFLVQTEQVVPRGGEHAFVDVDAELRELLAH